MKTLLSLGLLIAAAWLARPASAATFTVNTTSDSHSVGFAGQSSPNSSSEFDSGGHISLRSALERASTLGGSTTINLPSGTYNLSLGDLVAGVQANTTIYIHGTGTSANTTIHQTQAHRMVFLVNYNVDANVVFSLDNVTVSGGNEDSTDPDGFGGNGGAILAGGSSTAPGNAVNLTNTFFSGNTASTNANGGAISMSGGGDLNLVNCTFSNNHAGAGTGGSGAGGAVYFDAGFVAGNVSIYGSTFANNLASGGNGLGGAIYLASGNGNLFTISQCTFTGNTAGTRGGAIDLETGHLTASFNRFTGNTAPAGMGGGLYVLSGGSGWADARNNWWGGNGGPNTAGSDTTLPATSSPAPPAATQISFNPWLKLTHTASPATILVGGTATLTAGFTANSAGTAISPGNLGALIGLPITFNNAVKGALSSPQATIQASGTATAVFTGNAAGAGSADAKVDNATATAAITINAAPATHFAVSAPASTTAGSAFNATVIALDALNNTVTGYAGTVHFTSSDPQAALPGDYTFTAGDAGVHTFSATLKTAGTQTLTATDTATASITGTQSGIVVTAAAATHFTVNAPASATAGVPFSFTVTALDPFNNTATAYAGTVHFTKSDSGAGSAVPANYTFVAGDNGVHTFVNGATLVTAGNQTLTATDTVASSITGTSGTINVGCPTITATASGDGAICAGGSAAITVTVSGGAGPYTITLDNSGGTQTGPSPLTFNVNPASTTTYHVASGHDNVGCSVTPAGSATVTVGASSITVVNANDSGAGSLRQAILDLCPGGTITFAPALNGQTITLTGGQLTLNKSLTISGSGANLIAVSGNQASRVFDIIGVGTAVTISGLTITQGAVSNPVNNEDKGGGIRDVNGTLTLLGCSIIANSASEGGGIWINPGNVTILNSTIASNTATVDAGGIIAFPGSTLSVVNSTIANNTASTSVAGGLAVAPGVVMGITNSTIARNTAATSSGGILSVLSSTTLKDTIVALNTAATAPDYQNTFTSAGYNLIGNNSGTTINNQQASDQVGTSGSPIDPLLGALGNNGGPTPTLALLAGSPAIDAGDPAFDPNAFNPPLTNDQRGPGFPRIFNSRVDIGAYELSPDLSATGGFTVTGTEGSPNSSVTVATFTDRLGADAVGNYTATINWGDATTSAGSITLAGSTFTVTGSHTYAEEGSYTISVTIAHTTTTTPAVTANSTAAISDPAVVGTGGFTLSGTAGVALSSQTVATFADPGGAEALGDYSATINWGDGSPTSAGTITLAGSTFTVQGGHTYAAPGTYTITVNLSHDSAPPQAVNSTATIGTAASTTTVVSSVNPSVAGQSVTFTATVTSGAGTPTGTVQFKIDGSNFGSPVTLIGGTATSAAISTLSVAGSPHTVTALYSGDANFTSSAPASPLLQTVIAPPTAGPDTLGTTQNTPVNAPVAKLLANDSSPTAGPLSITAVTSPSTQGGTVVLNGGFVTYTPAHNFIGTDTFTYTLSDTHATAQGTVTVTVSPDGQSLNTISITGTLPNVTVIFAGIPGQTYVVQWATSATGPWTDFSDGTLVAGATGLIQYTDSTQPPPPARFFRTRVVTPP